MKDRDLVGKDFDSSNILLFVSRWRRTFLFVCLAAVVISAVASFLVDEKFKSTVVLFPVSTNSISKALLSEGDLGRMDILKFGEEEEAEQLMQILHSDQIRDRIITKFNLVEHYDINQNATYPQTLLFDEFESNITFKRTEFMSVKIEVLDKVPEMAALIANEIAALSDSARHRIQQQRAVEALRIVEKEYLQKEREVKALEDSLSVLRQLGIYDYHLQTEILTEQLAQAMIKGKSSVTKSINETFDLLAKYGAASVSITDRLYKEYKHLSLLKGKYEQVRVDVNEELPYKFVVNHAVASEKKTYPVRWLIVVISVIASFLITLLAIMTLEKINVIKTQIT